jgi:hypothetical protein
VLREADARTSAFHPCTNSAERVRALGRGAARQELADSGTATFSGGTQDYKRPLGRARPTGLTAKPRYRTQAGHLPTRHRYSPSAVVAQPVHEERGERAKEEDF